MALNYINYKIDNLFYVGSETELLIPSNSKKYIDYAKERYGSWSNVPTYGGW